MASIRNRNGKWQARVVRKGIPTVAKTFLIKSDAEKWARQVERDIDRGSYINTSLAEKTTFKEIIQRYIKEVTPSMKGCSEDTIRLNAICRRPIANIHMTSLTPSKIADYRDDRLKSVSAGTVIRELCYFSSIINHARREWNINIDNPVSLVRKPPAPTGRSRTLSNDEKELLLEALTATSKNRRNIWMNPLVEFALETAMRRGEMLSLRWSNIDYVKQIAFISDSKNGDSRYIPLSKYAIEILKDLPKSIDGCVFPINDFCVAAYFMRATKRAGIQDFHFHDLRHTAITNMMSKVSNLIELSAISGHKTLSMLKRYTHINAEEIAKKLG